MNDLERYLAVLREEDRRRGTRKISTYFPETGQLRRSLYPKHMQFFAAGHDHNQRLFLAGNRTGKTEGAGVELTYHLTGDYPFWWKGRRFNRPVDCWVAGDTAKTTRDILQTKLFGKKDELGTGIIPGDKIIGRPTSKAGTADAFDSAAIRHKSGGISRLAFKSFDQGRSAFEGTEKDVVWLDEESPLDIYTECMLRTLNTTGTDAANGLMILTFTPLRGMSETVLAFLPNGEIKELADGPKFVIMAGWDDVPHLTARNKAELLKEIPEFQRDARTKGIPQLGAGAIYPVPDDDVLVDDFVIPAHWPKAYGLDVGWKKTSAGFWTLDRDSDILYRYSEHYRGMAEPSVHAQGIKARGDWLKGVIDPAARGRSQVDGQQLMKIYKDLGLTLFPANNSVESGIYKVWERMSSGRLKVFRSCQNWIAERRLYRRDEKGHIVKENDHAMDDTRYFVMSGIEHMQTKPIPKKTEPKQQYSEGHGESWMS